MEAAVTAPQGSAAGWRSEAERWEREGVSDAAQECWERALELEPDDPAILLGLGRLHLRKERLARARICFERIVNRGPRRSRSEAAHALEQVRKMDRSAEEALDSIRTMLQADKFCAEALAALGRHCMRLGHLHEARANLEDALRFGWEDRFPTLMMLGGVHAQLGDDEAAAACFARALEEESDMAWAWYERAAALRRLGRSAAALRLVRRAQALDSADASIGWLVATLRTELAESTGSAGPR